MVEKQGPSLGTQPLLLVFGSGYLGRYIGMAARSLGWRVMGLTRNPRQAESLRNEGWEQVVVADLDGTDWWPQFDGHPDFVVNTVSSAGGGLEGYVRSYVRGNASIMGWAQRHPQRSHLARATFVYTSSTGVYPEAGGNWVDEEQTEESPVGRAQILLEAERLVRDQANVSFRRWFILRLAGLYGPGRAFLIRQLREGGGRIAGRGEHFLNLVRVEDAAQAVVAALAAGDELENRIWNVADGAPFLKREIVSWLGEKMGYAPPFLDGLTTDGSWRGSKNRRVAADAIRRDLGWNPRFPDFREGLGGLLTCVES